MRLKTVWLPAGLLLTFGVMVLAGMLAHRIAMLLPHISGFETFALSVIVGGVAATISDATIQCFRLEWEEDEQ